MKPLLINKHFHADENLKIYLRDIARYKTASPQKEIQLAIRIRKGDKEALKTLIRSNLRFVVSVARNYQNQGMPLIDLINDGNVGLINAARRFDEKKNFKFISYAVWWIRQAILQGLADHSRILRIPLNRVGTMYKVGLASSKLEQVLNRLPNCQEIANELGIPVGHVTHSMKVGNRHSSLDAPININTDGTLFDFLWNEDSEETDDQALHNSQTSKILDLLKDLTPRQHMIIRLYYGINETTCYTLEEIGNQLSLTRERIRQIKDAALNKLRRSVNRNQMSDFIQ